MGSPDRDTGLSGLEYEYNATLAGAKRSQTVVSDPAVR